MLNPKMVEVYGEGSRDILDRLVTELGYDMASKCYAITSGGTTVINGYRLPQFIATEYNDPRRVRKAVFDFIDNLTDEWEGISVFLNRKPEEGDIKICL